MPFVRFAWIGDILTALQLPKLYLAAFSRMFLVMAMKDLGYSFGSYELDYTFARPFGLMLAYILLLAVLLMMTRGVSAWSRIEKRILRVIAILVFIDFWMTLNYFIWY